MQLPIFILESFSVCIWGNCSAVYMNYIVLPNPYLPDRLLFTFQFVNVWQSWPFRQGFKIFLFVCVPVLFWFGLWHVEIYQKAMRQWNIVLSKNILLWVTVWILIQVLSQLHNLGKIASNQCIRSLMFSRGNDDVSFKWVILSGSKHRIR